MVKLPSSGLSCWEIINTLAAYGLEAPRFGNVACVASGAPPLHTPIQFAASRAPFYSRRLRQLMPVQRMNLSQK
jgi:hypothetical protein